MSLIGQVKQLCVRLALFFLKPVLLLGLYDAEVGLLENLLKRIVRPLHEKLDTLSEKLSEIEMSMERQTNLISTRSVASSPQPPANPAIFISSADDPSGKPIDVLEHTEYLDGQPEDDFMMAESLLAFISQEEPKKNIFENVRSDIPLKPQISPKPRKKLPIPGRRTSLRSESSEDDSRHRSASPTIHNKREERHPSGSSSPYDEGDVLQRLAMHRSDSPIPNEETKSRRSRLLSLPALSPVPLKRRVHEEDNVSGSDWDPNYSRRSSSPNLIHAFLAEARIFGNADETDLYPEPPMPDDSRDRSASPTNHNKREVRHPSGSSSPYDEGDVLQRLVSPSRNNEREAMHRRPSPIPNEEPNLRRSRLLSLPALSAVPLKRRVHEEDNVSGSEWDPNYSRRSSSPNLIHAFLAEARIFGNTDETDLYPEPPMPDLDLKLPEIKTPPRSPYPNNEINIVPLLECFEELSNEPTIEQQMDPKIASDMNCCLSTSDFYDLFEQRPFDSHGKQTSEDITSEDLTNIKDLVIGGLFDSEIIENYDFHAKDADDSELYDTGYKLPRTLVRAPSTESFVSQFDEIDHQLLTSETARSKRAIFQQRRKTKETEKLLTDMQVSYPADSLHDTVTDSSLEKITYLDPDAFPSRTISPWNSFQLNEELGEIEEYKRPRFADQNTIDAEIEDLDADYYEESVILPEKDQTIASRLSPDYQHLSPEFPGIIPPPLSPSSDMIHSSTLSLPPSLPPSPSPPPLKTKDLDFSPESENIDYLGKDYKGRSLSLMDEKIIPIPRKQRSFSVANILKKFDSSSDSEVPRKRKSSLSPLSGIMKRIGRKKSRSRPGSCPPLNNSGSTESLGSSYREVSIASPSQTVKSSSSFEFPTHKPPVGLVKKMKKKLSRSHSDFVEKEENAERSAGEPDEPSQKPRSKRSGLKAIMARIKSPKKKDYTKLLKGSDGHIPESSFDNTSSVISNAEMSSEVFDSDPELSVEETSPRNWANFDSAFNTQNLQLLIDPERSPSVSSAVSSGKPPIAPSPTPSPRRRYSTSTTIDTRVPRYAPCVMPDQPDPSYRRNGSLTPTTEKRVYAENRPLFKSKSVDEIISKFENQNFKKLAPHLATQISNNVTLQKAIFDIIEEEGYALIKRRQDACNQSESVDLFYRGKSLDYLADKAKECSNLDLGYLRKISEIQKSGTFTDSEIIKGLKSLIDDKSVQGPRKLFLCSFLCNVVESISNTITIEATTVREAYTNTLKHFKSTSDAIDAIDEPGSLAAIENKQNDIVRSILESLISISFQSMFEKDKGERYLKVVIKTLLRKHMSDKLCFYRKIKFHASVQIRNCLMHYFKYRLNLNRKFLLKKVETASSPLAQESRNQHEHPSHEKASIKQAKYSGKLPSRAQRPENSQATTTEPEFAVAFQRTRTKVFRDKARKMEDFRTQYVLKLCVSNMLESMSQEYRRREVSRRHHFTDICQSVLSNIVTEPQFSELVSCVVQDLLSKYIYLRLQDIRDSRRDHCQAGERIREPKRGRTELGIFQTFHRQKSKRGSEIVERVCYSPIPNKSQETSSHSIPESLSQTRTDSQHSFSSCQDQTIGDEASSTFTDFCCQVTLDDHFPEAHHHASPTLHDSFPEVHHHASPKEYLTSTTQIIPGDFDPTPPTSLTSLLTQTEIASTQTEGAQNLNLNQNLSVKLPQQAKQSMKNRKTARHRSDVIRSRSLDSALGDDSLTSSASVSSKSKGNYLDTGRQNFLTVLFLSFLQLFCILGPRVPNCTKKFGHGP